MTLSKKTSNYVLFILSVLLLFSACRKSHSDIGEVLFRETKNKVFKQIETDAFISVFKKLFEEEKGKLRNPKFLQAFYENNDFEPVLLMQQLPKGKLRKAIVYLNNSGQHGLDPSIFDAKLLNGLIEKIYKRKAIKTVEEAYKDLAMLELAAANSLTTYSNAIQFGLLSPRKIYAQYFTATKRPDSIATLSLLNAKDAGKFLDSIQPGDKQYKALQLALQQNVQVPGTNKEESERILKVNLERLRWKNMPAGEKHVWVNIPDFRLDIIENGHSVLNMKVCVGEGRNKYYTDKLMEYDENDLKKDRPFLRETPQLMSMIHSVQVNPVWNIPESIATNEITKYAAKDPHYLANNNIDVFLDGVKVDDPETVNWASPSAGKTYTFKQRPGDDNSLGKIKFLFNNESSVYLHDTPAKAMFRQNMRAVSHGCVRVEKPLELARALFGEGAKLEEIKKGMASKNPVANDISLPKKVPVYLTYFTCWMDESGTLQFRKDVYGLDIVLYTYLQRMAKG